MRLTLPALIAIVITSVALADENGNSGNAYQVMGPHGGYNVIQGGAPAPSLPFFGSHGYAVKVVAEERLHKKKSFIIVPTQEDDGHGNKHTVYKKVFFATPDEAAAAQARQ